MGIACQGIFKMIENGGVETFRIILNIEFKPLLVPALNATGPAFFISC